MIIDEKALRAMQQPGTQTVALEMTEERKERYKRVADQIMDLLRANASPLEAYSILQFITSSLESSYGIRGGFAIDKDGEKA